MEMPGWSPRVPAATVSSYLLAGCSLSGSALVWSPENIPDGGKTCPANSSTELVEATLLSLASSRSHHTSRARVRRHHKPSVSPSPTCHLPDTAGPSAACRGFSEAVPSGACKLENRLEKDCSPKSSAVLRGQRGLGLQGDTRGRFWRRVGS